MTKVRTSAANMVRISRPSASDLYPKYAWELVEKGGAYCCFCTKEAIDSRPHKPPKRRPSHDEVRQALPA